MNANRLQMMLLWASLGRIAGRPPYVGVVVIDLYSSVFLSRNPRLIKRWITLSTLRTTGARSITTTSTGGGLHVVAPVGKQCICVTSVLELKSSPAIGKVEPTSPPH